MTPLRVPAYTVKCSDSSTPGWVYVYDDKLDQRDMPVARLVQENTPVEVVGEWSGQPVTRRMT